MSEAVVFDAVSKRFILHHERARSFQEVFVNYFQRRNSSREEFWALKDVSFAVERGETLGIIGENGSGKSTALKLLTRIFDPTRGRVLVRGKVSALLELGAGFHHDLTGRENIFLNGSILGMRRKELEAKYDEIVEFSGLGKFIDTPIKHFSSGMYARLGFAIAVSVDPDILVIDEVLAVGDEAFQRRCGEKMSEFQMMGKTIILVSHALEAVRNLCSRAVWLDHGVVQAIGPADEVVERYQEAASGVGDLPDGEPEGLVSSGEVVSRWGSREAEIMGVELLDGSEAPSELFFIGEPMTVRMKYRCTERLPRPVFGLAIYRADGLHLCGPNTKLSGYTIDWLEGEGEIDYRIESLPFLAGRYHIAVSLYDSTCTHPYDYHDRLYPFEVRQGKVKERFGSIHLQARWHLGERQIAPAGAGSGRLVGGR